MIFSRVSNRVHPSDKSMFVALKSHSEEEQKVDARQLGNLWTENIFRAVYIYYFTTSPSLSRAANTAQKQSITLQSIIIHYLYFYFALSPFKRRRQLTWQQIWLLMKKLFSLNHAMNIVHSYLLSRWCYCYCAVCTFFLSWDDKADKEYGVTWQGWIYF